MRCYLGLCLALMLAVPVQSAAEQRIALVIGNGAYAGAGVLPNPVNDARDIAAKLKQLGFAVTLSIDADYMMMRRALTDFGRQVTEGTVALFFYAGHGMQVRGKNYLLPVDARIQIENDVGTEAMDVDFLLDKLNLARLSVVILDACRNNPFERRFRGGSGAGLAHMAAPTGTLIAYSTAPGKVAADGDGRNGLYTGELLEALSLPGLQVEDVFKHVRSKVVKLSGNVQTPWEASSLTGSFYFNASDAGDRKSLPQTALPAPQPVITNSLAASQPIVAETRTVANLTMGSEEDAWQQTEHAKTTEAYLAYMKAFPAGNHYDQAKSRVARLKRDEAKQQLGKVFRDCADCPDMVIIPGGRFEMGSSHGTELERPVHDVNISQIYALGRTEVTQKQWREIMGNNPSRFSSCGDNCPVENASWDDIQFFAETRRQDRQAISPANRGGMGVRLTRRDD
ncbi:MAG: caspase family protein [Sterolibacterium sp.]|nr:caspase family protein [Sterolibacterium sp.]